MKYTVVWVPSALSKLADLYNNAPDKKAVTRASNRIDVLLAHDADQVGMPFHTRRMLFDSPLAVTFSVSPADCLVEVLKVEFISQ